MDILLIGSRPENLQAAEDILTPAEYQLVRVSSREEALQYLQEYDPALILIDIQMPDPEGYRTASLIKSTRKFREIPIIFMTALDHGEYPFDQLHVHKAYDHGAVDYVYRPFDAHILRSKVAVFVELARKTRRLVQTEILLREAERKERERQVAEIELKSLIRERAEQRKYRDLVEGIEHGVVWSIGAESKLTTFVGPSAESIFGYPKRAWLTEVGFFANHLYPADRAAFVDGLERVAKGRRDIEFDHRFVAADGRQVWLHTVIRFAKSAQPGRSEIRALSVDISQIKEAEAALRRSKARSDFLAAASALLSESLETEKTLAQFSRLAVPRVADWQAVDIVEDAGRPRTVALTQRKPDGPELRFPVEPVLLNGRSIFIPNITDPLLDNWFPNRNDRTRAAEIKPRSLIIVPIPVRDQNVGALTFVSCTNTYGEEDLIMAEDLGRRAGTALENASLYRQAQEAIRARDEFLSIASHELKTPLTPLKLQTQSLRRALTIGTLDVKGSEKIVRMLDSSDRQITRISRLVDDLLDISRISSGKMQLSFEDFGLAELLHEIVDRFADEIKIARCTVRIDCSADIQVRWDRFRIEQVVVNLLTNAIKYGPGEAVEIFVAETDGLVTLAVRDRGIGIADADQSRVFGRFERAVSGAHFGGLGLGLYIVAQILDAHAGTISLTSRTGEGSTFTVKLASRYAKDENTGGTYSISIPKEDSAETAASVPALAIIR